MTIKFTFKDLDNAWLNFLERFVKSDYRPFRGASLRQAGVATLDERIPHIYLMKSLKSGIELPKIHIGDESEYIGIITLHSPTLVYEARIRPDGTIYIFTLNTFDNQPREKWSKIIHNWLNESVPSIRQQTRCMCFKMELIETICLQAPLDYNI